ncbi:hypothetical protein SEA_JAMUN_58 [Arthrobacter phage Jamun]|nr:hypothetical protein SEA_JAMUN_58 [Arthrobacter phage Jamun]
MAEKFPVTVYGRKVGMGQMIGKDRVSVELDPAYVSMMRQGMTRGLSADLPEPATPAGAPSPPVGPVPEPVAARPCGCLPGEECILCRNSFAFRRELRPGEAPARGPFFRQNWEAIQDELGVNLRGEPVPGFKRAPFPFRVDTEVRPGVVRIEGGGQLVEFEVEALLCSTSSHAGTVPAVVSGVFRVPWWEEGRTERPAYCSACARLLGFMGYFTPDEVEA